ncbi:phosphomannose isomerase type II C-terminal cupin domain [Patescibacteria group bacterium]|nr:phosphomannose isomerase type II C-terminal cupin domain [Patescibacteria group bacterium]
MFGFFGGAKFERLSEDVVRPWGSFHALAKEEGKWFVKLLKIRKGERISLQKHKKREEMWFIISGKVKVQKGTDVFNLGRGESVFIEKEELHRLKGLTDAEFIEVSLGDFDEDDEVRLEDDYGRVG